MDGRIFQVDGDGNLETLSETRFPFEDDLQRLLEQHPELLPGEAINPDNPRRWLLISREKGVAETAGAGDRWSVDHLLIDQDAIPTLVETKLATNPELRRTVVGQLLEYGAHAWNTWSGNEIRDAFENSAAKIGREPDELLGAFLGHEEAADSATFWDEIETNLRAQRLRLLFVADEIPDPLRRVVEFLNQQMASVEVLAVEIKQFQGPNGRILVPQVFGRTAASSARSATGSRQRHTRESFLTAIPESADRETADRLFTTAEAAGAFLQWGSTSASIRVRCSNYQAPVSLAWITLPGISGWMGVRECTFGVSLYDEQIPLTIKEVLSSWISEFMHDRFGREHAVEKMDLRILSYVEAGDHIDLLGKRLSRAILAIRAL